MRHIYGLKPWKDQQCKALVHWLRARRIDANKMTLLGLILGLTAAGALVLFRNNWGVILLGLSVIADMLDGAIARLTDGETQFGKLLDSFCDRLVESAWIGVLVIFGRLKYWALLLVVGSLLLMACRLLAHRRKMDTSFVLITRFERMVAMFAAGLFPNQDWVFWLFGLVTLGTFFSSWQIGVKLWEQKHSRLEKSSWKSNLPG